VGTRDKALVEYDELGKPHLFINGNEVNNITCIESEDDATGISRLSVSLKYYGDEYEMIKQTSKQMQEEQNNNDFIKKSI